MNLITGAVRSRCAEVTGAGQSQLLRLGAPPAAVICSPAAQSSRIDGQSTRRRQTKNQTLITSGRDAQNNVSSQLRRSRKRRRRQFTTIHNGSGRRMEMMEARRRARSRETLLLLPYLCKQQHAGFGMTHTHTPRLAC